MNPLELTPPPGLTLRQCRELTRRSLMVGEQVATPEKIGAACARITHDERWSQAQRQSALCAWLLEAGLALPQPDGRLELSLRGSAFCSSKLAARKPKQAAWARAASAYARMLASRDAGVTALAQPSAILIFGSLLNEAKPDHGDADFALLFSAPKARDPQAQSELRLSPVSTASQQRHAQLALKKDLIASDPFISLHDLSELGALCALRQSEGSSTPALILYLDPAAEASLDEDAECALASARAFESADPKLAKLLRARMARGLKEFLSAESGASAPRGPMGALCQKACAHILGERIVSLCVKLQGDGLERALLAPCGRLARMGTKAVGHFASEMETLRSTHPERFTHLAPALDLCGRLAHPEALGMPALRAKLSHLAFHARREPAASSAPQTQLARFAV